MGINPAAAYHRGGIYHHIWPDCESAHLMETTPYALMVLRACCPGPFSRRVWQEHPIAFVNNGNLIGKVYFPRLIVPIAAIVVAFVDFLIAFVILLALFAWYQFLPSWQIIFLPLFIALAFLASIGPSLWITALNVQYRDFRYIIPFIVQFGLYVSPVGFSSNVVPEQWRSLYSLNPVVGVIGGFRWCLLGGQSPLYLPGLALSIAVTAFSFGLVSGNSESWKRSSRISFECLNGQCPIPLSSLNTSQNPTRSGINPPGASAILALRDVMARTAHGSHAKRWIWRGAGRSSRATKWKNSGRSRT